MEYLSEDFLPLSLAVFSAVGDRPLKNLGVEGHAVIWIRCLKEGVTIVRNYKLRISNYEVSHFLILFAEACDHSLLSPHMTIEFHVALRVE